MRVLQTLALPLGHGTACDPSHITVRGRVWPRPAGLRSSAHMIDSPPCLHFSLPAPPAYSLAWLRFCSSPRAPAAAAEERVAIVEPAPAAAPPARGERGRPAARAGPAAPRRARAARPARAASRAPAAPARAA